MPKVADAVAVLSKYENRYRYLDVFADDLEDFKKVRWMGSKTKFHSKVAGRTLVVQNLHGGVLRLSFGAAGRGETILTLAALGTIAGAATNAKNGALAGLGLGMLVGALAESGRTANPDMNRIMALRFDPLQRDWVLYDGALLPWAKETLVPTAT